MNIDRFAVKFPAQVSDRFDSASLIPIFHEWIRDKALPGTLLDVADYRHVPEGPGIMLITYETNFALDSGKGELGLYAQQKVAGTGTPAEQICNLVRSTATLAHLLETDQRLAGQLEFQGGSFQFMSNDRLGLPNSPEGFETLKPTLQAAVADLYPQQSVTLSALDTDPRERLTVQVQAEKTVKMKSLCAA